MNRRERRLQKKLRRKTGGPKPEAVPFLDLAYGYSQSGRLNEATTQYLKVLEVDPEYAPAHNNYAATP